MSLVQVVKRSLKYVLRLVYGLLCLQFCVAACDWGQRRIRRWRRYFRNMRSYRFIGKSQAPASKLRIPVRFLGEIHIVITGLILAASIGILIKLIIGIDPEDSHHKTLEVFGMIFYLSLTLISSLVDLGLAVLLIFAAKQNSANKALIWYRGSISVLTFFCLISLGFGVMLKTPLILLPILPNLVFKPFALWVVDGFIDDVHIISAQIAKKPPVRIEGVEDDIHYIEGEGGGDMAGPSRKRSTSYALKQDSSNANEEEILERRALILKAGKCDIGASSSRLSPTVIRQAPVLRPNTVAEE